MTHIILQFGFCNEAVNYVSAIQEPLEKLFKSLNEVWMPCSLLLILRSMEILFQ